LKQNKDKDTPLACAVRSELKAKSLKNVAVIDMLLKNGAKSDTTFGDNNLLQLLLKPTDPNSISWAAVLKFLIYNSDIFNVDENNETEEIIIKRKVSGPLKTAILSKLPKETLTLN